MKRNHVLFAGAVIGLFVAGCSSVNDVQPSDITVAELEAKQMHAVDPTKRIKSIKTSILRQEITTSQGWLEPDIIQMVEIKYQAPDKMNITTFDENQPDKALILNGDRAWRVDFSDKSISVVPSNELANVQFMQKLAAPNSKMSELFDKVTIDRCTIDDEPLYRLTCVNPDQNPFYVYVAVSDHLPRRITSDIKMPGGGSSFYDSRILRYQMYEGQLIADETVIDQDGLMQKGKVLYYKINTPINEKEFRPPVF